MTQASEFFPEDEKDQERP